MLEVWLVRINVNFSIIKIKLHMFGSADFSSKSSGNYLLNKLGNESW